jgi:sugar lactone lactonase YvrE
MDFKLKKAGYLGILAMTIFSCSNNLPPAFNGPPGSPLFQDSPEKNKQLSPQEIAGFNREYAGFKTEALTANYLKSKLDKWIADSNGTKLLKELQYSRLKLPTLINSLVSTNPGLYSSFNNTPEIIQAKGSDVTFGSFIDGLNPFQVTPVLSGATNIGQNTFTANWSPVSGVSGYLLSVITGGNTTSYNLGTVNTFNLTNLSNNTKYSYNVRTLNGEFTGGASNTVNTTTLGVYNVSTFAGMDNNLLIDDKGGYATFKHTQGMISDTSGNIFVCDSSALQIRKVTPTGTVSVFATGFTDPEGITIDTNNILYVADGAGGIKKVDTAGNVSSLVASTAVESGIWSLTWDGGSYLYYLDNEKVKRAIILSGVTTIIAGNSNFGFANGSGSFAKFNSPTGIVYLGGILYVSDYYNAQIRRVTTAGSVTTLAGTETASGSANGTGTNARFNFPYGIAKDKSGDLLVADSGNNLIRKITTGGLVSTVAGQLTPGYTNAAGTNARFITPIGITADNNNNYFVTEQNNRVVRKIGAGAAVTTLAGGGNYFDDLIATRSRFFNPKGIARDNGGNFYIADSCNNRIRKISTTGEVTTFAGGGAAGLLDGTGSNALFNNPAGVAADSSGNIFVTDLNNGLIRKITPGGVVTTYAGSTPGFADNTDRTGARFTSPDGITTDTEGNIYISDRGNQRIRKIDPNGFVTTVAGQTTGGFLDALGTNAKFSQPAGIVADNKGNLFVADFTNKRVRKIDFAGNVTTLAGSGVFGGANGQGTNATFSSPAHITIDGNGVLYLADSGRVRRIDEYGNVTTAAGASTGFNDGTGTSALFSGVSGIVTDSSGNIFVTELNNNRVRKIIP